MPDFFIEIFNKLFPNWIHVQVSLQNELFENRLNWISKKIPFKAFFQSIRERVFIVFVNLNSNEAGHYELCLDPNYVSDYGPRLIQLI